MAHIAGMSMAALRARIAETPCGTSVAIAGEISHVRSEYGRDGPRTNYMRVVNVRSEITFTDLAELTRETILQAVDTTPSLLLEALEASALPDDEWRSVEASAIETIEATRSGAPTCKVDVSSRKHLQFIGRHAPYHVRQLTNGGVLLATHPYRTLWPLYKDALFLLGITP